MLNNGSRSHRQITKTVWLDDKDGDAPDGYEIGTVAPDGTLYQLTFAADIEGHAEFQHSAESPHGSDATAWNEALLGGLFDFAARVRASGARTPEEWLEYLENQEPADTECMPHGRPVPFAALLGAASRH